MLSVYSVYTVCRVYLTVEVLRGPQEVQRSSETLRRQGRDRTIQLWARGPTEPRTKSPVQVPAQLDPGWPVFIFIKRYFIVIASESARRCIISQQPRRSRNIFPRAHQQLVHN